MHELVEAMVQSWVRNFIVLAVMTVWSVVVLVSLMRGMIPDPITWGIPGGLWALFAAKQGGSQNE